MLTNQKTWNMKKKKNEKPYIVSWTCAWTVIHCTFWSYIGLDEHHLIYSTILNHCRWVFNTGYHYLKIWGIKVLNCLITIK